MVNASEMKGTIEEGLDDRRSVRLPLSDGSVAVVAPKLVGGRLTRIVVSKYNLSEAMPRGARTKRA